MRVLFLGRQEVAGRGRRGREGGGGKGGKSSQLKQIVKKRHKSITSSV